MFVELIGQKKSYVIPSPPKYYLNDSPNLFSIIQCANCLYLKPECYRLSEKKR